jgi:hypothetical protein
MDLQGFQLTRTSSLLYNPDVRFLMKLNKDL